MSTTTDNAPHRRNGRAWQLEPDQTIAEFRVKSFWGLTTVRGRLAAIGGSLSPDGRMEMTIDAASVRTGNPLRDRHLRSSHFFAADQHPHVRFQSTSVQPRSDGRWQVAGELQAAGRPLEIELTPTVRFADDRLEVHAEMTIDQRQLGMTYARFGIRTPATVTVSAHLRPASSADADGLASVSDGHRHPG